MNRNKAKLRTLEVLKEMVESNVEELGPVMDDYDGGQKAAYDKVLEDIKMYQSIISHCASHCE
tara:strand:+ start:126 stop:314 length:189 start_codon:yes stop_codon:yes gene_type:complete